MDSDNPLSRGEVGKVGVPMNSLKDVEIMLEGIPLEEVQISTTSNAIGPIFLALMLALAEKRDISPQKMRLSIQNDILKEFVSRNTFIFPPEPSLRFSCDLIEYCYRNRMKGVQSPIMCGYHMREAGSNVIQELAFVLANTVALFDELVSRGINIDDLHTHPFVGFTAGMDFFEEICKCRAYRRMFARMMKERYKDRSFILRPTISKLMASTRTKDKLNMIKTNLSLNPVFRT